MTEVIKPIWKNYPKTYRVPVHLYPNNYGYLNLPNKYYLSKNDSETLLGYGEKIVREKFDGVSRTMILEEYDLQIFYEDLTYKHIVDYYERPKCVVYAIWDIKEQKWLDSRQFSMVTELGVYYTPPILIKTFEPLDLNKLLKITNDSSYFGGYKKEGIIIMNETYHLEGKIINPEYDRD